jgi:hypothetical protein
MVFRGRPVAISAQARGWMESEYSVAHRKRVTARWPSYVERTPPAPFFKGGEKPASSHFPFNKGGWGGWN